MDSFLPPPIRPPRIAGFWDAGSNIDRIRVDLLAAPAKGVGPPLVPPLESASTHALVQRHAPRFVRDSLRPRGRRDGRSVSGTRYTARPRHRDQDPARGVCD